jgi:hypothetical protein
MWIQGGDQGVVSLGEKRVNLHALNISIFPQAWGLLYTL